MGLHVLSLLFKPELSGLYLKKGLVLLTFFFSFVVLFRDSFLCSGFFFTASFFSEILHYHLHVAASGFGAGVRAVFCSLFFGRCSTWES